MISLILVKQGKMLHDHDTMPPLVSFKISDHDSIGITILVTKVYLVWEGDREWEVSLEE